MAVHKCVSPGKDFVHVRAFPCPSVCNSYKCMISHASSMHSLSIYLYFILYSAYLTIGLLIIHQVLSDKSERLHTDLVVKASRSQIAHTFEPVRTSRPKANLFTHPLENSHIDSIWLMSVLNMYR